MFRAMLLVRGLVPEKRWPACDFVLSVTASLREMGTVRVCAPDPRLHPAVRLALGQTRAQVRLGEPQPRLQQELAAHTLNAIYFALGSASGTRTPVLVLAAAESLPRSRWQRVLQDAAKLEVPAVFALLPGSTTGLAGLAESLGVPGIPVGFADPVALYRVAGECLGRALAGGGPALLEAVQLPGCEDAMPLFRGQMMARGAATEEWLARQERTVRPSTAARQTQRRGKQVH